MELSRLQRRGESEWWVAPYGKMRVPAVIYASEPLMRDMDDKVFEQVTNVATLPGIVKAAYAMPDAHWGYGFPIGGVAAFDADEGGVISAGGVGFDVSCGVRTMLTTNGTLLDDDAVDRARRLAAYVAVWSAHLGPCAEFRELLGLPPINPPISK